MVAFTSLSLALLAPVLISAAGPVKPTPPQPNNSAVYRVEAFNVQKANGRDVSSIRFEIKDDHGHRVQTCHPHWTHNGDPVPRGQVYGNTVYLCDRNSPWSFVYNDESNSLLLKGGPQADRVGTATINQDCRWRDFGLNCDGSGSTPVTMVNNVRQPMPVN